MKTEELRQRKDEKITSIKTRWTRDAKKRGADNLYKKLCKTCEAVRAG